MSQFLQTTWAVLRKEWLDAIRDRRTLLSVLLSSVLIGPLMLVLLSFVFSQMEQSRESRTLYIQGAQHAPSLMNFLARQSIEIKEPPVDFRKQIQEGLFSHAVLIVSETYLKQLENGEAAGLTIVTASTNRGAASSSGRLQRLVNEYSRENNRLELSAQGIAAQTLRLTETQLEDLSTTQSTAAQFTSVLPIFIVMAILYGALNAAMDTTAGERERGSLEPLLLSPASRLSLVTGKWAAVAGVAMLTATLSVLSFFPAQWLIQTETLKAMFNFGWREAVGFLLLLLPFAAGTSALFMAVAIRSKTFKEAHANNTLVILGVSMMPLITMFDPSGNRPWFVWIPGLGQQLAMNKVIKTESLTLQEIAIPALVSVIIALLCIRSIEHQLKNAAIK